MKPKLLFLAKVFLCSLGLFVIWHPISQAYISVLKRIVALLTTTYELSAEGDLLIYKMSLYMIPFLSLMVITPKIPIAKRAAVMGIGILVSLVIDIIFIQYTIQSDGATNADQNTVDVLVQSLKLLLPLLLWLLVSPSVFNPQIDEEADNP